MPIPIASGPHTISSYPFFEAPLSGKWLGRFFFEAGGSEVALLHLWIHLGEWANQLFCLLVAASLFQQCLAPLLFLMPAFYHRPFPAKLWLPFTSLQIPKSNVLAWTWLVFVERCIRSIQSSAMSLRNVHKPPVPCLSGCRVQIVRRIQAWAFDQSIIETENQHGVTQTKDSTYQAQ